jgi:hypothetical protein
MTHDTDPLPLWSLAASELARDAGQARVLERAGTFHADAVEVICRRLAGAEVLAEEFRRVCSEEGVAPHHHNAWGGPNGGAGTAWCDRGDRAAR